MYDQEDIALPNVSAQHAPVGVVPWAWDRGLDGLQNFQILNESAPLGSWNVPVNGPDSTMPRWAFQSMRRGYYSAVSWSDHLVGMMLTKMDELQVTNDTVTILTSDHGYHLGEGGMWAKETVFEDATHVPLIIRCPWLGQKAVGFTDSFFELVDLMPTAAELAGVAAPAGLDGTSQAAVMRAPQKVIKHHAFSQFPRCAPEAPFCLPPAKEITVMGIAVRTAEARFTQWWPWDGNNLRINWTASALGSELYLHHGDPSHGAGMFDGWENVNHVHEPQYQEMVENLTAVLRRQFCRPPLRTDDVAIAAPPMKLLFLNASAVAESSKIRFTMHPPVPVDMAVVQDKPWESFSIGDPAFVIPWPLDGSLRLYYGCAEKNIPHYISRMCLAVSRDGGLSFSKPNLGLVKHNGRDSNIVFPTDEWANASYKTGSAFTMAHMFRDDRPGTHESVRWKAVMNGGPPTLGPKGVLGHGAQAWVWGSADGLRFRPLTNFSRPSIVCSDTQDTALGWNHALQRYAFLVRHDGPDATTEEWGPGTGAGRRVTLCLTKSLSYWGNNYATQGHRACGGAQAPCLPTDTACCKVLLEADPARDPSNLVDICECTATVAPAVFQRDR